MVYGRRKRTIRDICGKREVVESDCKVLGLHRWKRRMERESERDKTVQAPKKDQNKKSEK